MGSRQVYPSWTLFFSWGGFVFLSINFFTGILLSNIDLSTFISVNTIALILLAITLYPTIYLSSKYHINYSQAIYKFIENSYIRIILILLVVCINIGWYSIQLNAIQSIVLNTLNFQSTLLTIAISYLFAYGSYRLGYEWLKSFSIFTMLLFLGYLIIFFFTNSGVVESKQIITNDTVSIFTLILMVYGTWAFSSSTIVMDIVKYTNDFKQSYLYILLATIFSNFTLIALGYFFARYTDVGSFEEFVSFFGISFGLMILVLSIWTTNDSNFFSSMKALESLNIQKRYIFIVLPFVSALLSLHYGDDLFSLIGDWLKLMSWIAIPLTIFWWHIVIKLKYQKSYIGE